MEQIIPLITSKQDAELIIFCLIAIVQNNIANLEINSLSMAFWPLYLQEKP